MGAQKSRQPVISRLATGVAAAAFASLCFAVTDSGTVECSSAHVAHHNPQLARISNTLVCFEAYLSNFDTDKSNNDGGEEILGVPHWIVQRVKQMATPPETRKRPRAWFTVPELQKSGFAPTDDSYKFSKSFRDNHPNWYERGHLAQKYLAERVSETAGWFTHNVVNAVPQRAQFNKGAWLSLECLTGAWANHYGDVWVVAGPVFIHGHATDWLKSDTKKKALPVAIPEALFKIVVKKSKTGRWDTLAFVYPQEHKSYKKGPWNEMDRLTSIAQIERLTNEEFFPGSAEELSEAKNKVAAKLWSVRKDAFDTGCKKMAKDIP